MPHFEVCTASCFALPLLGIAAIGAAVVVGAGWGGLLVLGPPALLSVSVAILATHGSRAIQDVGRAWFRDHA